MNNLEPQNTIVVLNVDGGGRSVPTLPLLIYSYFPNTYKQEAVVTSSLSSIQPPFPIPNESAFLNSPVGRQDRIEATILAMLSGKDSPYNGAAGYGSFFAEADMVVTAPPVTGQVGVAKAAGDTYKQSSTGSAVVDTLKNQGRVASVVFSGTVTDVTLDTEGLDYGVVTVTGSGSYSGDTFTIQYENENICAYKSSYPGGTPYVLGPDSIAYVPTDGTVFDNSDLYNIFKQGGRPAVDIVAILASSQITDIADLMQAWAVVRAAIPSDQCNYPYTSPWLNNKIDEKKRPSRNQNRTLRFDG